MLLKELHFQKQTNNLKNIKSQAEWYFKSHVNGNGLILWERPKFKLYKIIITGWI